VGSSRVKSPAQSTAQRSSRGFVRVIRDHKGDAWDRISCRHNQQHTHTVWAVVCGCVWLQQLLVYIYDGAGAYRHCSCYIHGILLLDGGFGSRMCNPGPHMAMEAFHNQPGEVVACLNMLAGIHELQASCMEHTLQIVALKARQSA